MAKAKKKTQNSGSIVPRDLNILLSQKGEINLNSRTIKDKTKYSRKEKHKNKSEN